jgi:hypothetical protein
MCPDAPLIIWVWPVRDGKSGRSYHVHVYVAAGDIGIAASRHPLMPSVSSSR